LGNFRPGDVGAGLGQDRQRTQRDCRADQLVK
jgi:hypothetical protein